MNKAVQLENETSASQQESINEVKNEGTRSVSISFFIHRLIAYADARRSIAAFIFILLVVAVCDTLFSYLLFEPTSGWSRHCRVCSRGGLLNLILDLLQKYGKRC